MNVLIGISWPFANGDLHIGHGASSLPGDVIARYHRLKGNNVVLVSGSDCHGTPIDVKALETGKTQKEIVDECHQRFSKDFYDLGVSFDLYNRTDDCYHKEFVKDIFKKYYDNNYLYEKVEEQLYCSKCNLFLADRYIVGECPKCGANIKGDECEKCGSLLTIDEVFNTRCSICGEKAIKKENKNLYFRLSNFQDDIKKSVDNNLDTWRDNAIIFTNRYLSEGIPDRCASRSLNWGIDIPVKGYEDKKIYGWFENVWGYVSACKKYCENNKLNYEDYWKNNNSKIYLVHAKDNIPFHTVIFPSLLLAANDNYQLPNYIVSDEYITIEGEKLSKSKGNYISLRYLLDRYPKDVIRFYFIYNDPEKRDFNFTWNDFINSVNSDLLGKWGNFVNRNLKFINKSFDGVLKEEGIDLEVEEKLIDLFDSVGKSIDSGYVKDAIRDIFDFISYSNKYFDELEPWKLANEDKDKCNYVLYNCLNIISNINTLLKPFLPDTCLKVEDYININNNEWIYKRIDKVSIKSDIEPLFIRYDKSRIDEEISNLKKES